MIVIGGKSDKLVYYLHGTEFQLFLKELISHTSLVTRVFCLVLTLIIVLPVGTQKERNNDRLFRFHAKNTTCSFVCPLFIFYKIS